MKGFRFRYWKHCVKQMPITMALICFVVMTAFWLCHTQSYHPFVGLKSFLTNLIIGALLGLLVIILTPILVVAKNSPLYSVLDKYGFSREYLAAYEKERIIGKPFKPQYAVEYAEIFMRIGQPSDAIKYLNTITLPDNTQLYTKVAYFYIYVFSALKIHNLNIAEDMWKRNIPIIDQVQKSSNRKTNNYLLYLTLIAVDMYAGQTDRNRLERAYQQTVAYINGNDFKNPAFDGSDYKIFLIYQLNVLGRKNEALQLYNDVHKYLENYSPLFSATKGEFFRQLERAKNGLIPFLD